MGNSNSLEAKDKKKEDLIFDIEVKGNRLNRLYTEKYLDPDYDHEYFDKLDLEYAIETEEEYASETEEEDYIEQNKYYWKY